MLLPMSIAYFLTLVLFHLPRRISAQDYTVPSGWENTVFKASRADFQSIACNTANELQHRIDPSIGYPQDTAAVASNGTVGNMVIVLASQDWRSGNDSWEEQVDENTLPFYESGKEYLDNRIRNAETGIYTLAELAAYLAYNNSSRLDIAKRNFDIIHTDFISASAAQTATYPRAMNTSCSPSTLGGLLFLDHVDTSNMQVDANAIGPWVALSARLYELTGNSTYLDVAEQSVQFMQTYMVDPSNPAAVVKGIFNPATPNCAVSSNVGANADDVGFYLEGLSIVANVTANQTYIQMLEDLIPAVVRFRNWHSADGILKQDTPTWCSKGSLIRGLLEARLRNPANKGLVTLIDAYIAVQLNAVQDNAYTGGNDYAISWGNGASESAKYTTVGNVEALDVLNAASVIAPVQKDVSPHSPTVGAIVGAVVGGIASAVTLALVVCILLRRRRRVREMPVKDDRIVAAHIQSNHALHVSGPTVEPFILLAPAHNQFASVREKSGFQQQVVPVPEPHDDGMLNDSWRSSVEITEDSSVPPTDLRDSNALQALERRLEMRLGHLVHALVNYGETESNPPEYDGNHPSRISNGESV